MSTKVISEFDLPMILHKRGKVRDVYDLGDNYLLIATDRISSFDHVLPNPIPLKGIVLNQISLFWFDMMKSLIDNHVLESDFEKFPSELKEYPGLAKRSIITQKAEPVPIECVVRGYLSGSGWLEYQDENTVCGIPLQEGLVESDKLPEPIFTPATKESTGHDINISFEKTVELIGEETANFLKDTSISIYKKAAGYAFRRGIIIADTKFEFGKVGDDIILIDELLTPDSSRFWPTSEYSPGGSQKSFDKQYVRDYLLSIGWNKEPPIPNLPEDIVEGTTKKYLEAYEKLTGKKLE